MLVTFFFIFCYSQWGHTIIRQPNYLIIIIILLIFKGIHFSLYGKCTISLSIVSLCCVYELSNRMKFKWVYTKRNILQHFFFRLFVSLSCDNFILNLCPKKKKIINPNLFSKTFFLYIFLFSVLFSALIENINFIDLNIQMFGLFFDALWPRDLCDSLSSESNRWFDSRFSTLDTQKWMSVLLVHSFLFFLCFSRLMLLLLLATAVGVVVVV